MKFNFRVLSILIVNIFFVPNLIFSDANEETTATTISDLIPEIESSEKTYVSQYQFEKGYEEAIEFIKEHEGFNNGYAYTDVAGIRTIGYGHVIMKNEKFPERISEKAAESLLRKDFDKAVRAAERETNLSGYQKITIAHFIFAKGIGNYLRSNLKKLVDEGKPVDEELKKWCYYRSSKTGKLVRSEWSYKIRLWEIAMYNRGKKN